MRTALFGLGLLVAAGAFAVSYRAREAATEPRAAPRAQSCADDCEQAAIVEARPEAWTRACIARCGGSPSVPTASSAGRGLGRDVRSVTRAPAQHGPPSLPSDGARPITVAPADHRR